MVFDPGLLLGDKALNELGPFFTDRHKCQQVCVMPLHFLREDHSVLDTSTLYPDSTVVDGTAYCYASTAVNTSNEESGYSNIVSNIQIPPP